MCLTDGLKISARGCSRCISVSSWGPSGQLLGGLALLPLGPSVLGALACELWAGHVPSGTIL